MFYNGIYRLPAAAKTPRISFPHISFNEMFNRLNEMWKEIICNSQENDFSEGIPKKAIQLAFAPRSLVS